MYSYAKRPKKSVCELPRGSNKTKQKRNGRHNCWSCPLADAQLSATARLCVLLALAGGLCRNPSAPMAWHGMAPQQSTGKGKLHASKKVMEI